MTGKELLSIRQRLGVSQSMLAEALGVHTQTVSKWERGGAIDQPVMLALALEALLKRAESYDRKRMNARPQKVRIGMGVLFNDVMDAGNNEVSSNALADIEEYMDQQDARIAELQRQLAELQGA